MYRNTYKKGRVTFFIFPQNDHLIGVCLELNIVVEGYSLRIVREELSDAVKTYVETIIENKLSETLLNRPAPQEYWQRFFESLKTMEKLKTIKTTPDIESIVSITTLALPNLTYSH